VRQEEELLRKFKRATGASPESIAEASRALGIPFPADYAQFMQQSNGGEGPVGAEGYLVLWPIEELEEQNEGFHARELYPGLVLIGTNGGAEAVALRRGPLGVEVVLLPFMGEVEDALFGGNTFFGFLDSYGSGSIRAPPSSTR
jgi:SMI1 / KNR4 family (SUKH-1)